MGYPRVLRVADLVRAPEFEVRTSIEPLPHRISLATAELPAGTLVTLEIRRPWWDRRRRSRVLSRLQTVMDRARKLERAIVVAAAIRQDGRVLLAQRDHPPAVAGLWEFPGGKVERGESLPGALIRECREELGVSLVVGPEIGRTVLPDGAQLVLFDCRLADGSADAKALEHRALKWADTAELGRAELDSELVATNRGFVAEVSRGL